MNNNDLIIYLQNLAETLWYMRTLSNKGVDLELEKLICNLNKDIEALKGNK